MLPRVALALVLIGVLGLSCSESASFSFEASLRPPQAGTSEVVAKVLLYSGKVTVVAANGHRFGALPEQPLLRTDTVVVPAEGFAILQFANFRLTRLDADVRLRLADAAGLDAPAAQHSVQQQLTRLLTPTERSRTERIVGWHARMSAAEGVAVQPKEDLYAHKKMRRFEDAKEGEKEDAQAATAEPRVADSLVRPVPPVESAVPPPPPPPQPGSEATPPGMVRGEQPKLAEDAPKPRGPAKVGTRPRLQEGEARDVSIPPTTVAKPAATPQPRPRGGKGGGPGAGDIADVFGGSRGGDDLDDVLGKVGGLKTADGRRGGGRTKVGKKDSRKAPARAPKSIRLELVKWIPVGVQDKKPGPAPAGVHRLVQRIRFDDDCLLAEDAMPQRGQTFRLLVWVKIGHVTKVVVPGKTPTLGCLKKVVTGKPVPVGSDVPDGTYTLVVRFK